MDSQSIVTVLTLIILILLSAFFSSAETAFSALNRIRVKNTAGRRAKLVLKLYDDYDKLISTVAVGNNVVSIAATTVATVFFIKHFGDRGVMLGAAVMTVAILVFAEITPKCLSKDKPEKVALFFAPLLNFFIIILTPVNAVFSGWKTLLKKAFHIKTDDRIITEQELLNIIEEAQSDGAIEEDDTRLIHNALEFNDLCADEILTPRMGIVGMPKDIAVEDAAKIFLDSGYSRIPVYDGTVDNIVGIVHIRDFLQCMVKDKATLDSIVTPAVYVAPSTKISELFKMLQRNKIHMVVIGDEYGGTEGIVTIEDILEELVGEIWDESDEIIEEFVSLEDGSFKVLCSAEFDKMLEFFGFPEDEEVEASTVGGFIMDTLEKIPEEGDTFEYITEYKTLRITVSKALKRKALECTVTVV